MGLYSALRQSEQQLCVQKLRMSDGSFWKIKVMMMSSSGESIFQKEMFYSLAYGTNGIGK